MFNVRVYMYVNDIRTQLNKYLQKQKKKIKNIKQNQSEKETIIFKYELFKQMHTNFYY